MPKSIMDIFDDFFEIVPAATEDLKLESYKLRYQVYCLETGFEDPVRHPTCMEKDEFDHHSIHYLIHHKRLNTFAATTRLILPDYNNPETLFPIELHSQIDNHDVLANIPRTKLGEVSRFCVSRAFKNRKKEAGTLTGNPSNDACSFSDDERRIFPHLTIALIASLVKISAEHDIQYWYAVMEPALLRFLSTLGISFIHIGPLTNYHGKRQPSVIKVSHLLNGVANRHPELSDMLTLRGKYVGSFN